MPDAARLAAVAEHLGAEAVGRARARRSAAKVTRASRSTRAGAACPGCARTRSRPVVRSTAIAAEADGCDAGCRERGAELRREARRGRAGRRRRQRRRRRRPRRATASRAAPGHAADCAECMADSCERGPCGRAKMGRTAHDLRGRRLLGAMSVQPIDAIRELEPLLDEIAALLDRAEADDDRGALERTLTDGYAHALTLEAERTDLERQVRRLSRRRSTRAAAPTTSEVTALARRLDACDDSVRAAARRARPRSSGATRRAVRSTPRWAIVRRARTARRRPRPGSGSRSAASSGCSRCGS